MVSDQDIQTKWVEFKGGVMNQWGNITNEELDSTHKTISEIKELVQQKYANESYKTINDKMDQLLNSFDNDTDKLIQPAVSSFARSPIVNEAEGPFFSKNSVANTVPDYNEKLVKSGEKYRYINDTAFEKKSKYNRKKINPNLQTLSGSESDSIKGSIVKQEFVKK